MIRTTLLAVALCLGLVACSGGPGNTSATTTAAAQPTPTALSKAEWVAEQAKLSPSGAQGDPDAQYAEAVRMCQTMSEQEIADFYKPFAGSINVDAAVKLVKRAC